MWSIVFGVLSLAWFGLFIGSALKGEADNQLLMLGFLHMIVAKQWRDE